MLKSATSLMIGTALAATLGLAGCYTPSGGWMPYTGGPSTYFSTQMMQKTVTLIDKRTNEVFFSLDIPADKQLVIDFDAGDGDDPVNRPDMMYYEVMPMGKETGKLHNSMPVPPAACRLVKVDVRQGVEYATSQPDRQLRTDEVQDRPDWWSPNGGPMPEDKKTTMYDN